MSRKERKVRKVGSEEDKMGFTMKHTKGSNEQIPTFMLFVSFVLNRMASTR